MYVLASEVWCSNKWLLMTIESSCLGKSTMMEDEKLELSAA